jgi:hypothetical protein
MSDDTPLPPVVSQAALPVVAIGTESAPVIERYQIRRITWSSAFKIGAATGWLLGLVPAMLLAWGVVTGLGAAYAAVAGIKPMDIAVLGQSLATIDPIQILGQEENVATLAGLAASSGIVFVLLTLLLTLCFAVLFVIGLLLFVAAYNLLAKSIGGLELELAPPRR